MSTDPRVDTYIDALPDWQQLICRNVRQLIHAADHNIEETIKFTDRPYFTRNGNICALLAAGDHVNVFICDPIAPDSEGIINQGHDNKTARSIQIYRDQPINEQAFISLIRFVVAHNDAGGWRRLSMSKSRTG